MNVNQILPLIATAFLLIVVFAQIFQKPKSQSWIGPFIISILLLLYSAYTITLEGPLGFWANHTKDFWGNQIWFDLLISIGTAFIVLLKRFKAQNMNVITWFVLVLASGSIGLLAMVARLLYLEAKGRQKG
ncbi:MAG: hypothetical protein LW878_02190 [Proteobacteria bacterium]|jgi:hypothetical protein|nr:hypothetical protein [Pseudomonadota bacterium]